MARIRYLKPDFFTDENISELKYVERLVFQGLWCHADRDGRLEDKPKFLKVVILPYDNEDMDKILNRLSSGEKPFIKRYSVDGKDYILIINFLKHQNPHHTEKDSIIPVEDKTKEKEKIKRSVHDTSTRLDNGAKTVKEPLKDVSPNDFDTFWAAYPRKTGKDCAAKSWATKKPPLAKCLETISWQTQTEQWLKEGGKYIPMPATWINQGRWLDEPLNAKPAAVVYKQAPMAPNAVFDKDGKLVY